MLAQCGECHGDGAEKKPGIMYKSLGSADAERAEVPAITKEQLDKRKLPY